MPNTVKITATTPYGVFTRKTHRTYTHVVLVTGYKVDLYKSQHESNVKYRTAEAAKYKAVIDSGIVPPSRSNFTVEDYQRWYDGIQAELAAAPAKLAEKIAATEHQIANEKFWVDGWCGRPDLAEKAAAKARSSYTIVKIYPVD